MNEPHNSNKNKESRRRPSTQEQRDQLRSPGRAVLDGQGYRVEDVQSATTAIPASKDRSAFWSYATDENGATADLFAANMDPARTFIPVPDGQGGWDRMSLAAARNTPGLIQKDGRGAYPPFPGSSSPTAQKADGAEPQTNAESSAGARRPANRLPG